MTMLAICANSMAAKRQSELVMPSSVSKSTSPRFSLKNGFPEAELLSITKSTALFDRHLVETEISTSYEEVASGVDSTLAILKC